MAEHHTAKLLALGPREDNIQEHRPLKEKKSVFKYQQLQGDAEPRETVAPWLQYITGQVYSVAFDLRSSTLSVTDDLSSLTLAPALSTAWLIFSCSSILEVMPVATRTPGQYVSGWCEWVRREQGGSVRCGSRRAGVRTVVLVEVARGGRGGVGGGLQLHGGKGGRVLSDAARGGGGGAAGRD